MFICLFLQVIGVQWLVSSPAEVVISSTPPIIAEAATSLQRSLINLTEVNEEAISRLKFQSIIFAFICKFFMSL